MNPTDHEHVCFVRSTHHTSQGTIVYESCSCSAQRVMLGAARIADTPVELARTFG